MEGTPKQLDKLNILAIVAVGLVGVFGLYASFVGLQAFFEAEARKVAEARFAEEQSDEFRSVQAEQQGEMQDYRWRSQAERTVTVPIGRAMELVIADIGKGQASNLVPSVGPHDTPTVPAVFGRPPDNVKMPAKSPSPGETEAASEGAAPAPESAAPGSEGAAPESAAPEASAEPSHAP